MWVFIVLLSVTSFFVFLMLSIISLFKNNGKAKKYGLLLLASFVIFLVAAANADTEEPVKETFGEIIETDNISDGDDNVHKEKLVIEVTEKLHDVSNNRIIVKGTTNIEDGIEIGVSLKSEDIFDIPALPGFAIIQDGEFEVSLEYDEYIISRNYRLTASMGTYNEKFSEVFQDYDFFNENYEIEGTVRKTDIGFVVDGIPLGQIDIIDGVTEEYVQLIALEALKEQATELDFAHLNKNPDRHKNEYVTYRGEIVQIQEGNGWTVIRLSVTPTSYGYDYSDIIWVEYEGYTDFIDGDIVTIYGTVLGSHSYTSQAGWEITLPAILADIVE